MSPSVDQAAIDARSGNGAGWRRVRASWSSVRSRLDLSRPIPVRSRASAQKDDLVDSVLLVSLRALFAGMAAVIIGSTVYLSLIVPISLGLLTLLVGLVIGGAFLLGRRRIIQGRVQSRWAHPLAAGLSAMGFLVLLYDLVSRQQPSADLRFVGLTLSVVLTGALYLRLRWLLGMMAFMFVTWTAVNLALGLEIIWSEHLILFPIIAVGAVFNFAGRARAISRMIDAQLENERQNAQLAEALERAHLLEAKIRVERDLADQIVDSMGQGLVLVDERGTIEYVNPAAARIIGSPMDALVGRPIADVLHSPDQDSSQFDRDRGLAHGAEGVYEVLIDRADGDIASIQVSVTSRGSDGTILSLTDLTLRKQFEARLQRLAHYDALTGLANRSLLIERTEQALIRLQRRPSRMAMLFLDLDRFKPINDTAGHAVGDEVLIQTARRIQECIREQDTAARIGGDEFVVLLVDVDDTDMTLEIADRIARRIEEPFVIEGRAYTVAISIGVVTNQSPAADAEDLLRAADTAMYEAKRRPDVTRILYTPDLKPHAQQQLV